MEAGKAEVRRHKPHCWRAHPKSAWTTEHYRQNAKSQRDCASVNASTGGEHSSMQINLEGNNQSAHILSKMGLKCLVRPCNNWQRNILLQFRRSSCVFNSGRVAHLSDALHPGHGYWLGTIWNQNLTASEEHKCESYLEDLKDPLKDDFLVRENENAELA